ncbi:MAG: LytTR family DNA-binding domain-containing protein [Paludibacter sp.]
MKILIIEDEQPAAKRLEKMLLEIAPDFEIVHRCDSIESSVLFFKSGIIPDLVMLDVQLGDGLSFEIFKQVEISCPVIFTTAYDEYAIKAFELNSIDYLLKPISKEKLEKSIEKFKKLNQQAVQSDWKTLASLMDKEKREYKQRFLVYVGEHLLSVQTSDIAYFYSVEKSTFLTTKAGKSYPLDLSLEKLEGMLSPKDFFRINRQYITSFESIRKMSVLSKSRIKLTLEPLPSDEILISNARTRYFREWLDR